MAQDTQDKTKHTPGPWRFEQHSQESDWFGNIVGSYGRDDTGIENIRTISCQTRYGEECEQLANARLIAAAPDLYRELAHLVRLLEPLERNGGMNVPGLATLNGARAAIAKAEGASS